MSLINTPDETFADTIKQMFITFAWLPVDRPRVEGVYTVVPIGPCGTPDLCLQLQ